MIWYVEFGKQQVINSIDFYSAEFSFEMTTHDENDRHHWNKPAKSLIIGLENNQIELETLDITDKEIYILHLILKLLFTKNFLIGDL